MRGSSRRGYGAGVVEHGGEPAALRNHHQFCPNAQLSKVGTVVSCPPSCGREALRVEKPLAHQVEEQRYLQHIACAVPALPWATALMPGKSRRDQGHQITVLGSCRSPASEAKYMIWVHARSWDASLRLVHTFYALVAHELRSLRCTLLAVL